MLTRMTEDDWAIVLEVFDAAQSRVGEPGHNDRKFLEALHFFTVHNLSWRALPKEYGNWNSVWKRFWRLSRSGTFEAFFQLLAETSQTAHLAARSPSQKAVGAVLSDDWRALPRDRMRHDAGAAGHLRRRGDGRFQRQEANYVLRDDLHPDRCPQSIDAERAEIFVEVAQPG